MQPVSPSSRQCLLYLSFFSDYWRAPSEAHDKNQKAHAKKKNKMARIEKEREWST
jgi:hypothetical protein